MADAALNPVPNDVTANYDLFGLRIRSQMPLPDLVPASASADVDVDVDVEIIVGAVPAASPDEKSVWGLTGNGNGATLTVDHVARFAIDSGVRIRVDPLPNASARDVRLFLLGSAFGALLHQRGLLPIHANAIRIGDGAAAFMGRSGAGKSTLAGAFLDRGFRLLADDVCVTTLDKPGRPMAQPGLPRLRLWRDAVEALGRNASDFEIAFEGHEKYVVPTHGGQLREAVPLTRLYLLSELPAGETGQVIRRLKGIEALEALMANIYRGHYLPLLGGAARNLQQCLTVVAAVPMFEVRRQMGHDVMDAQIRGIEAHARSVAP